MNPALCWGLEIAEQRSRALAKIALIAVSVVLACIVTFALTSTGPQSFLGQDLDLLENSDGRIVSCNWLNVRTHTEDVACYKLRYLSDRLKVVGFLVKPRHEGKYPAIIYNRGGNREYGKIDSSALFYLSCLSSRGYVVVASQYRGNDGSEGREEFGGSDVNDVLNLIPMLESLPFVDSGGIVMLGYSRGGMMTWP